MKQSKRISGCGIAAALCVVIMLLGGYLGLGMYVSPVLAGLCLVPVGNRFGRKYHLLLWFAVSILSFLFVPNVEQNLLFFGVFGIYPVLYPYFARIPVGMRILCKLLWFNLVTIAVEAAVLFVLAPETMGSGMLLLLLFMANVIFICYDRIVPKADVLAEKYLGRLKRK